MILYIVIVFYASANKRITPIFLLFTINMKIVRGQNDLRQEK